MTQGFLLEVRIGVGEPASIALLPGTPLDPTSFGRAAMWRIGAEGVLDIHGYVYFDGGSLFVQSADEQFPVLVNRHRVSTAWTEIRAPSTLHVGQAQIVLKVTDTLARSGALVAIRPQDMQPGSVRPAPEPPRGPWDGSSVSNKDDLAQVAAPLGRNSGAPFPRGAFVPKPDDESTRFAPLAPAPTPASPFGPGAGPGGYDPRNGNTSPVVPIPIPLSAAAPPPSTQGRTLGERIKADWYATSMPKRILFVLSPLVLASYFSLLFGDDDNKGGKGAASASASSSGAGLGTLGSVPPVPSMPPPPSLDAAGMGFVPAAGTTGATTGLPPPLVGPSFDAGKKGAPTPERAAADAYAQGNLPLALVLYERLDRERPGNPAIEQAVRVLRERLDAGR